MKFKRQTAYKFWLKDIAAAVPKLNPEGARHFEIRGREAIRVNVIAPVISAYSSESGQYSALTIDDGSMQVRMKAWEGDVKILEGILAGDVIIAIARIHEYNGEIFLRPEIVRKIGSEWLNVRKEELSKSYGVCEPDTDAVCAVEEIGINEKIEPSILAREKIYSIAGSASEEGVSIAEIVNKSGINESVIDKAVMEMISEGEIYAPRAGFIKLV